MRCKSIATMVVQTRGRIFWPKMRGVLEACYNHCQPCTENRNSRAQSGNEIDMGDLFDNFFPNNRVQMEREWGSTI